MWLYLGLITLIWAFALNSPVPYSSYICILLLRLHLHANFRAIGPLFMEMLHFKDLGDTSVISECSLGVNLVIDILCYVAQWHSGKCKMTTEMLTVAVITAHGHSM